MNDNQTSDRKMIASIIIVSYNQKEYTAQAIDSCLSQDIQEPYEIIIVDDGSDDGSVEMISDYASKHPDIIKYAVMDRNDGEIIVGFRESNARMKGFGLSSGRYVTFLDSDDYFSKDKLRIQVDFREAQTIRCVLFRLYRI